MNKNILAVILWSVASALPAQVKDPIFHVLEQIEQNNLQLKAARETMKAEVLETKAENNLSNPEVNYAHLFSSQRSGQQQSELTVVQGFDFPTAYSARSKAGALEADARQRSYMVQRREVLLQAKLLCLDLIGLNREANLLTLLQAHADSLTQLCETRLESGDATALEVNRARLGLMALHTELADNVSAHRTALQSLLAMNANLSIEGMVEDTYPDLPALPDYATLCDEVLPKNHDVQQAEAESKASRKRVSVSRQAGLPKLQVGYRRNTAPAEEFNGFIIGGSIPLFENRNKVKAASARALSAELQKESVTLSAEALLQARYNEAQSLKQAMAAYDLDLMRQSFSLLGQALDGGQLTWHEYFVELEALIRQGQSYLKLENRYQKLLAELFADSL